MKAHWVYFKYVVRHKWYVFLECCKLGIPWLGIIHDWHKFTPAEWFPYVHYFYTEDGSEKQIRDKSGHFKSDRNFDVAWHHHQKLGRHHHQYWLLFRDSGDMEALPIPLKYAKEMLADWYGAAQAQGKKRDSVKDWYVEHRNDMILHPLTRDWIQNALFGSAKDIWLDLSK